jgi:hypothetical protein
MAAVTFTAAQVEPLYPNSTSHLQRTYTALVALTKGQSIYIDPTTGKAGLCDANDAGKEQFAGICMKDTVAAGTSFVAQVRGEVAGFDLSGLNYGAIVYQGDTAGALADAASGTKTIRVGKVVPVNGRPVAKALYVEADWLNNW